MSVTRVLERVIKSELENVFGLALAGRIIIAARAKAKAPIIGMTRNDYMKIIEAISMDDRVVGMWGTAGTGERKKRWKEAIGAPETL